MLPYLWSLKLLLKPLNCAQNKSAHRMSWGLNPESCESMTRKFSEGWRFQCGVFAWLCCKGFLCFPCSDGLKCGLCQTSDEGCLGFHFNVGTYFWPRRWRQQIPSEQWYLSAKPHNITYHEKHCLRRGMWKGDFLHAMKYTFVVFIRFLWDVFLKQFCVVQSMVLITCCLHRRTQNFSFGGRADPEAI
jgi:hypothetical protein